MRLKSFSTFSRAASTNTRSVGGNKQAEETCAGRAELMARRLNIELDFGDCKRMVGHIEWILDQRLAAVQWDTGFSAAPLPISSHAIRSMNELHIGRPSPYEGLPGVFADSLPDGWGRLLIDRELVRQGRALYELTLVDRLAIVGRQGVGALAYWPEEEHAAAAGPKNFGCTLVQP